MKFECTPNVPIYLDFFANSEFEAKTEKTIWQNKTSDNSLCFINPNVKYKNKASVVCSKLEEVFNIDNKHLFECKFKMAISGDGQEVKRIGVLHSSSLAALLLFYSISDEKPLSCYLSDGNHYTFVDSFFEVKTNVKDSHYSNMDVVLIGANDFNQKVIFFLECKFSEYLSTGMCNDISLDAYEETYRDLGLLCDNAIKNLIITPGKGKNNVDCLQIRSNKQHYCNGIKQIISHFIGLTNFAENGNSAFDEKQKNQHFFSALTELHDEGAQILLGEVLFEFNEKVDKKDEEGNSKLDNYKSIYGQLSKILNSHSNRIIVLPQIHTYRELLTNFSIEPSIRKFYQL